MRLVILMKEKAIGRNWNNELVVDAYPQSYKAIGYLGRLYEKNNDKENAKLFFGKALLKAQTTNPQNPFSCWRYWILLVKE